MEAMAARLAVIATEVGGIPDLIEQGRSGLLVPPRDPQAIADALDNLIANPQLRQSLGDAARARIRDHFDIDTMIARTREIYHAN